MPLLLLSQQHRHRCLLLDPSLLVPRGGARRGEERRREHLHATREAISGNQWPS
jgi:hypothetical protein